MSKDSKSRKERFEKILQLLEKNNTVTVQELCSIFSVSSVTIRNDLDELSRQGRLQRKYGGADSLANLETEMSLTEKQRHNRKEKQLIGMLAAKLINDGDSIMFDAGTTTEHVAHNLSAFRDLTIITNGLNIVYFATRNLNANLYIVEGKVDKRSFSILGEQAETALSKYNAKIGFVSADGLSFEKGLTNNSLDATNIARVILNNTQTHILVADSTKLMRIGIFALCDWDQIHVWVCDSGVPEDLRKKMEARGVRVIIS